MEASDERLQPKRSQWSRLCAKVAALGDTTCLNTQETCPKVCSDHRGMVMCFLRGILAGMSILLVAGLLSGAMALAFVLAQGSRTQGRMRGSFYIQPAGDAQSPPTEANKSFVATALNGGAFCDGTMNEGRWRHVPPGQASSSTEQFHAVLDSVGRNESDPSFSAYDDFSWTFDRTAQGEPCKILGVVDAMTVLAKSASRVAFLGTDLLSQVAQGAHWTHDLLKRRGLESTMKLENYSWGCITETHEMLYNAFSSMGLLDRQNEIDRQREILIMSFGEEYSLNSSRACDCNWAERNDSKALSFGERFFHNPSECFDHDDLVMTEESNRDWDTCIAEHSWTKCINLTQALCSTQVLDQCTFQRNLVYLSRFLSHNRPFLPRHIFWLAGSPSDIKPAWESSAWRDTEVNAILSKFAPHVRMIRAANIMKPSSTSQGMGGAGAHYHFNTAAFAELLAVTLSSFNAATNPAFAQRGTEAPEDTSLTEGIDFDIKVVAGQEVDPPQPDWPQHVFKKELEQNSAYGEVWIQGVTCATQMQSLGYPNRTVACADAVHKTLSCGDIFVFDQCRPFLGCHCCGKDELQYSNESRPASKHFTMYKKRVSASWEEKLLRHDHIDMDQDLWLHTEITRNQGATAERKQRVDSWKMILAMEAAAKAKKRQRSNVKK